MESNLLFNEIEFNFINKMSKRKEYLNKKKKRDEIEGESVTEEIGKNSNSNKSILEKDDNKTEEKLSTPKNTNLEKSSSTPSDKNKGEESHNSPLNDYVNKQLDFVQRQMDALREQNGKLQIQMKAQQIEMQSQKIQMQEQKIQIETLNSKVKELNEFYFAGKLRKLLKKLIQFIINNYFYSYMKYNKYNKKIYFVKAPKPTLDLKFVEDNDIIDALNRILEQTFTMAKSKDFIIHFIDKRANKDKSSKKIYQVFKNKNEFFNYFRISEKDKIILNEIFPEEYLTIIDNSSFDINIKSLINVVANIKTNDNDIEEKF